MSPETFWFVALVLIVANQVVIGLFCRYLAQEKNRDGSVWFWLGALLGPMPIALFTLIGLPALSNEEAPYRVRARRSSSAIGLLQQEGELFLDQLTTLSHDEALSLAKHEGDLSLSGLVTLSDEAASALARHEGGLSLNGLITLSDKAAKSLAQHQGEVWLNGLTTLSDEAVAALRANPNVGLPAKFRR